MKTITRLFKELPNQKRKSIIDTIVNVQGLKSPRTKAMKDYDKVRGTNQPRRGDQNLLPMLFTQCVNQIR